MDSRNGDSASSAGSESKTQYHSRQDNYERNHSTASTRHGSTTAAELARNVNAKLANPLTGKSHTELETMGALYARKHQVGDDKDIRAFQKGACLAQDPAKYENVAGLTERELEVLRRETTNRWSQPKLLYVVIGICSMCAAVQGMGE